MTEKIFRKYLEINSIDNLNEVNKPSKNYSIKIVHPKNFHINKFFYKNIGKNYQWTDRLIWSDFK